MPPRRIRRRVGPFENDPELFLEMGQDYLELMRNRQAIAPTDSVLDVGCGCGLMAMALAGYLTSGTYDGFDPDARLIRWCRRNLTPRFPAFRFRRVDVERYRDERARMRSSEIVFPYESATFDLVIVKSIFTHMFEAGIQRYMSEIHRVLRPGGQCVITWYVLDDESLALIRSGHSRWSFKHDRGNHRILTEKDPLRLVAHEETWLRELFDDSALTIEGEIHRGGWRDDTVVALGQDVTFVTKTSRPR